MKTVFNIDYDYHKSTGIGRYGLELMSAWISLGEECRMWVPRWMAKLGPLPEPFAGLTSCYLPKRRITDHIWPSFTAALKKIDWVHSANCMLLPKSPFFKQSCMVHDLGPLLYGQMKAPEDTEPWRRRLNTVAEQADCILVNSLSTMNDMLHYFPNTSNRIFLTPLGIDHFKSVHDDADSCKSHILAVGTIEPRKNIDGLLRAYACLYSRRDVPPLVIAGGDGFQAESYKILPSELGIQHKVRFTGYVSDTELTTLYSKAVCLVHTAHHEGFGFTVPEAFRWKLPVVASKTGGLEEFFSGCAWMVDPSDIDSIADGISNALEHGVTEAQQRNRLELSKELTWKSCAEKTIAAMQNIQAVRK